LWKQKPCIDNIKCSAVASNPVHSCIPLVITDNRLNELKHPCEQDDNPRTMHFIFLQSLLTSCIRATERQPQPYHAQPSTGIGVHRPYNLGQASESRACNAVLRHTAYCASSNEQASTSVLGSRGRRGCLKPAQARDLKQLHLQELPPTAAQCSVTFRNDTHTATAASEAPAAVQVLGHMQHRHPQLPLGPAAAQF